MPMDRFLIAPFKSGLQTDLKPWLEPEDAFIELENAYVFRGRVTKRFGSRYSGNGGAAGFEQLRSRARIQVGTTDGSGNISDTAPGAIFKIGQQFSVGDEIFTVVETGTPGTMLTTGSATVHTYDTTSGAFVINGADANTAVFFYPSEPIMGINVFTEAEATINNQPTIVFDTQFAYTFSGSAWIRSGTVVWHGGNSDFFWSTNWEGTDDKTVAFFVSNFQVTNPNGAVVATDDPMYYTLDAITWTSFSPFTVYNSDGDYVQTARIILPFQGRLVLLNTIEKDISGNSYTWHINRCRFSINGSPFAGTAGNYYGWLEPNQTFGTGVGQGAGFIDAPIEEQIIGAGFIKDRLIVYFERSTFELVYTGNEILPFRWQKINAELGSESTFSTVQFDKSLLVIGQTGVHACNGANVERIDQKIPSEIFDFVAKSPQPKRIAGIRDYFNEMVYWSFPSTENDNGDTFPDKILVFNYQNGAWALNDDCITAFGYFEQQTDLTWADMDWQWLEEDAQWNSNIIRAQSRQILFGNPQGFLLILSDEMNSNASAMPITDMTDNGDGTLTLTIIDNNIKVDEFITIDNAQGVTLSSGGAYVVLSSTTTEITITDDEDEPSLSFTGTYTGGGTSRRVSRINVLSKPWNPYAKDGRNVYIAKIDFNVLKTTDGEISVEYYPSYSEYGMQINSVPGVLLGTGVLETRPYSATFAPFEAVQNQLWHPVYLQAEGAAMQVRLSFSDSQMADTAISLSNFELEGLILNTQPTTSRPQ